MTPQSVLLCALPVLQLVLPALFSHVCQACSADAQWEALVHAFKAWKGESWRSAENWLTDSSCVPEGAGGLDISFPVCVRGGKEDGRSACAHVPCARTR